MTNDLPPAKFERFERVVVTGEPLHAPELHGKHGTVLWRDPYCVRIRVPPETISRLPRADRWLYLVYFPADHRYWAIFQAHLQSEWVEVAGPDSMVLREAPVRSRQVTGSTAKSTARGLS